MRRIAPLTLALVLAAGCDAVSPAPAGPLAPGVWGGTDAGLIVTDSGAHLHIGCTAGDVLGRIFLDSLGRFDVPGTYHLRLYPIAVGPPHPARFAGRAAGSLLRVTVTIADTAVVLGPVWLRLDQEPGMVNCPICRPRGR